MKRIKLLVLLLLLLLARASDGRVVELEVNELPKPSGQDVKDRANTAVLRRFLELHPEIRISRGTRLQMEGRTMEVVPLMQIAGDVSPHVIYVNFRFSDTYIQKGFLKPLDEYIARMPKEELDRRVPPAIRDVCYRYGPDGKKHWYCLPTSKLVRVLAYRKDLFARAGLDPERPPRTWTELTRYARKLTDHERGRYGLCLVKGDGASWDFANLVWSNGGEVVTLSNGQWRPRFNTSEVVDALHYYTKLNVTPIRGRDGRTRRGVVYRGLDMLVVDPLDTYAMVFTYLDERLNVYQPEMVGFAPIPRPDGTKHSSSEINAMMLGVFSGVKDPDVARAAYEYIAFLDSDEANRIRARIYIQRGYGKFLNPDLLRRFGYTDYLRQVDKEWIRVYQDALINGKPEPYGRNCSLVWTELSRPVEQAINDSRVISAIDSGDVRAAKQRLKEILDRAQAETEERMYGIMPPKVASFRRAVASGFLVLACLGFTTAAFYLIRMFRREAPAQTPGQKRTILAYALVLPAFAGIIVWQYVPLLRGTVISFQDYSVIGASPFIGIANFATVLFEPNFWHSMAVTLKYTVLYMLSGFVAPIVLALLLTEVPRGKVLFRTLFYLPAVLSGLVVVFLWKSFYKPNGLLNAALGAFGIHLDVNWLDSPTLAMLSVMLPVIWAGMGPGSLIYIAALKTIPEEFYEAADIDGAGVLKKISCVTIPGLKMLIMINAVGAFIGAFMTSEMILAMTGGGPYTPYGSTEVVGLQLFYTAFMYLKFGVANAMAWVLGFILLGFTLMQLRNLSRVEFKGGK